MKKLVSARLRSKATGPHPDADLLSSFAERALSQDEQSQVLAHLARCDDCRQVFYLAGSESADLQEIVAVHSSRSPLFFWRWGTLAAAVAVVVVVFVGVQQHSTQSLYKEKTPEKPAPPTAAELKTPRELDELHASRDDRANTVNAMGQPAANKIIPTPKRMTAKPAGKFDFDQSDQVRMASAPQMPPSNGLALQGRNMAELSKSTAATRTQVPALAVTGGMVGGPMSVSAVGALAQQRGQLLGTVQDRTGAVVANATVVMDGPIGTRAMQSDVQGQFAFDDLTPGSYSLKAEARGFKTAELQQVAVVTDKAANLRITLDPGAVSETVEVSAAAPSVKTSAAAISTSQQSVKSAPYAKNQGSREEMTQDQKQANELARKKTVAANYQAQGMSAGALTIVPRWTLSAKGAVQLSMDLGQTWQTVRVATGVFRALSSAGADVWVGGNRGVLYHSSDSGQSWTRVTPVASGYKMHADITRIDFPDAMNGTIGTAAGETWATFDGGQSWQLQ